MSYDIIISGKVSPLQILAFSLSLRYFLIHQVRHNLASRQMTNRIAVEVEWRGVCVRFVFSFVSYAYFLSYTQTFAISAKVNRNLEKRMRTDDVKEVSYRKLAS